MTYVMLTLTVTLTLSLLPHRMPTTPHPNVLTLALGAKLSPTTRHPNFLALTLGPKLSTTANLRRGIGGREGGLALSVVGHRMPADHRVDGVLFV